MLSLVLPAVACFAGYLLYAGTVSASEIVTGSILGLLGGLWSWMSRRTAARIFRFSAAHVRPWLRAIASLPAATARTGWWLLTVVAGRAAPDGRADVVRFASGRRDDPVDRARRATAVLAASLAPASYVLRAEGGTEGALIHGISGQPVATDAEWLA